MNEPEEKAPSKISPEELKKIKRLEADEAISRLNDLISVYPEDDELFLARGLKYWALNQRAKAIKDYLSAININPESRAKMALKNANEILDYYNKDLLNP